MQRFRGSTSGKMPRNRKLAVIALVLVAVSVLAIVASAAPALVIVLPVLGFVLYRYL